MESPSPTSRRRIPASVRHGAVLLAAALIGIAGGLWLRGSHAAHAGWGSLTHHNRTGPDLPGRARVDWVVDGDTFHVIRRGVTLKVRIVGIDAPELAHDGRPAACHGQASSLDLRRLAKGRQLRLSSEVETRDRYGRWLADATFVDGPHRGADLATLLARRGDARQLVIPPNDAHAARIASAVDDAVAHGRGLWSSCTEATAYPGRPAR